MGTHYHQQAFEVELKRHQGKGKTLGLQPPYYRYADSATGGRSRFAAQAIFGILAWRSP